MPSVVSNRFGRLMEQSFLVEVVAVRAVEIAQGANRLDHRVKTMLHTDWLRRENRFRFNDFVHGRSLMK